MNVLVTGGAGYVGSALVEQLAADPKVDKIYIYDNLSRGNYNLFVGASIDENQRIQFVRGDILDSRKLRKIMANVDTVVHLAAKATTPFADRAGHGFEQVNHWGTAELTYAVEDSDIKKLLYLSSISVYGSGPEPYNLESIPNPKTHYGISKYRGEQHVLRLMDRMPCYVLRCANVYGYHKSMRFDAAVNRFMFQANFNEKINIHGNGLQKRSLINIDLLSQILHGTVTSDHEPGIYNLAQYNFSILDIIEQIQEFYPEMEMIYVNQHLKMKEMMVEHDPRLKSYIDSFTPSFKDDIEAFKKKFAFSQIQ